MRIIVTTSDKYVHTCMPAFNKAFVRAWPDCQFPVSVVGCSMVSLAYAPAHWEGTCLGADQGWASNLLNFLGDGDEPFLLLLDDYILDTVDTSLMLWASKVITLPSVGMLRVHPCPGPTLAWPGNHGIGQIDMTAPYAISLQAAIWKPDVIRDLFRRGEDPWQTEIEGSRRAADYDRFQFLGTWRSAIGYRELMKRGEAVPEAQAWVEANLP